LTKLLEGLPKLLELCRTEGTADQIHELRVNTRRIRALLPLGRQCLDPAAVAKFETWSGNLARRTSGIRDCDIVAEHLTARMCPPDLAENLERRRRGEWQSFVKKTGLLKGVHVSSLKPPPGRIRHRKPLAKRLTARLDRLRQAVVREAPRFAELDVEQRHDLRRDIRRLRYLRELVLSQRQQPEDPLLRQLIRTQEALGEIQNCLAAEAYLKRLRGMKSSLPLRQGVARQRQSWERAGRRHLRALIDQLRQGGLNH
jgi:CHAD domain-containing protein